MPSQSKRTPGGEKHKSGNSSSTKRDPGRREDPKVGKELAKWLFVTPEAPLGDRKIVDPDYSKYEAEKNEETGEPRKSWLYHTEKISDAIPTPRLLPVAGCLQAAQDESKQKEDPPNNFRSIDSTPPREPGDYAALEAVLGEFLPRKKEGHTPQMHRHLGEELAIILSGEVRFNYFDGNAAILSKGDAIWFRSEMYHEFVSLTEEARAIVIWWSPMFCPSLIEGRQAEGSDKDSNVELFSRAQHELTARFRIASALKDEEPDRENEKPGRERYVKFCHGIPDLILHHLSRIGRNETSLRNWLNRGDRSIDEMIHGNFDLSEDALRKIAKHLKRSPADLFWRFSEKNRPWCRVLRAADFKPWRTPEHAVIQINQRNLGGKNPFEFAVGSTAGEPLQSARLFVPLDKGIRVESERARQQGGFPVAANPSQAIFVPKDVAPYYVFPDRMEAACAEISVNGAKARKLNDQVEK